MTQLDGKRLIQTVCREILNRLLEAVPIASVRVLAAKMAVGIVKKA